MSTCYLSCHIGFLPSNFQFRTLQLENVLYVWNRRVEYVIHSRYKINSKLILPWRWRQHKPQNFLKLCRYQHDLAFQNTIGSSMWKALGQNLNAHVFNMSAAEVAAPSQANTGLVLMLMLPEHIFRLLKACWILHHLRNSNYSMDEQSLVCSRHILCR